MPVHCSSSAPKGGMDATLFTSFSFQMSVLVSTLRSPEDELLQNNYRPVQNLHGRRVLASFQTTPSVKHIPGKECMSVLRLLPAAGMQ